MRGPQRAPPRQHRLAGQRAVAPRSSPPARHCCCFLWNSSAFAGLPCLASLRGCRKRSETPACHPFRPTQAAQGRARAPAPAGGSAQDRKDVVNHSDPYPPPGGTDHHACVSHCALDDTLDTTHKHLPTPTLPFPYPTPKPPHPATVGVRRRSTMVDGIHVPSIARVSRVCTQV